MFASFQHGTIDYTPHQATIITIMQAIQKCKICCLTYKAVMEKAPKTYYIKPLRMFPHNNTLYLLAQKAKTPNKPYRAPRFNPLLAVHRIQSIEKTQTPFEFPKNFDFEKSYAKTFGIMKRESFPVTVRLTGWAKSYMCERVWSKDQKIKENPDGSADITFTAASKSELISFILSLGDKARILKPKWLVGEVKDKIEVLRGVYQ
jgi:predicted DNA-binding transcriptional regulator YafY